SDWLRASLGMPREKAVVRARSAEAEALRELKRHALEDEIEAGGFLEAWARIAIHTARGGGVDERPYHLLKQMIAELSAKIRPSAGAVKTALKHQFLILLHDEERALAA